jgi:hypothetical protein
MTVLLDGSLFLVSERTGCLASTVKNNDSVLFSKGEMRGVDCRLWSWWISKMGD